MDHFQIAFHIRLPSKSLLTTPPVGVHCQRKVAQIAQQSHAPNPSGTLFKTYPLSHILVLLIRGLSSNAGVN